MFLAQLDKTLGKDVVMAIMKEIKAIMLVLNPFLLTDKEEDPLTVATLVNVKSSFNMPTDIDLREIHAAMVHRTTPQSGVVASFQTQDPEIFGVNFCNIKTFNDWGGGDSVGGVYSRIDLRIEYLASSLITTIEHTFEMYQTARTLCLDFFSLTVDFFCKMASMMQIFYHELMAKTSGLDRPSKESMAICWKIVLTLVKVIFRQL